MPFQVNHAVAQYFSYRAVQAELQLERTRHRKGSKRSPETSSAQRAFNRSGCGVRDYKCTTSPPCPPHPNDITGPRTNPAAGNPYQYGGLLDNRSETSFDATVGVHAHDAIGLQELNITCVFNCAGDQGWEPLKSFNNTAKQPGTNRFTLTSRALMGQPTTDLVFPITITTTDLKTVTCGNSQPSSGNGTILVLATAKNFSTNPATQITQGYWEILVGADSAVVVPPGVSH